MVKTKKFAVIGGDLRQARTAGALADDGFATVVYGISPEHLPEGPKYLESLEEAVRDASCVVLPLPALSAQGTVSMPLSDLKLTPGELFSRLAPGTLCFAGKVTPALLELADQSDVTLLDYFDREELTIRNAIPTAEGAIQIAMEELPITLHDSQCLVVGYGRIGKILADFLSGLGANVTVSARKVSDRAWIAAQGYAPADSLNLAPILHGFDVVFNTVPAPVLKAPELGRLRRDCLCIDLASAPGGIDLEAAARLGLRCIWALSLPGKVAPFTSGEIVYDTIMNMLKERRFFE